jgi:Leucine-rich repeat (LRR) protein
MVKAHALPGVARTLLLAVLAVAIGAALFWAAPAANAAGDPNDELFFYRSSDGAFRYYNIQPNASLGSPILGGTGYSLGWTAITAVDMDGDGQDEVFFYRSTDGAYRYYDIRSNGTLGTQIQGGTGYSLGWDSISAVDLDGDGQDEFFFYRSSDGAYRYYNLQANGSLGNLIRGGTGYSLGWDSISAVDLDGDGQDEMFFYRSGDGAYRYYNIQANANLGNLIRGGLGYSLGWDSISAVDLDGDDQDEMFFYRSGDGAFRYYNIQANANLGTLIQGGTGYSLGWDSITAIDIDFNQPTLPPPPPPPACNDGQTIPKAECDALAQLYAFTQGPNWITKTNWNVGNACTWFGVVCGGGHVIEINLSSNNLAGTIPSSLNNLGSLVHLRLNNNNLTSGIPNLPGLVSLLTLNLGDNDLSGTIPASLGSLPVLATLDLHDNSLTGAIPTQIGNLTTLTALDLSEARLTGTIPVSLGNLTNLITFDLSSNFVPAPQGNAGLSGTIPAELGNLVNLLTFDLSVNSLDGTIPDLSLITELEHFDLSNNLLDGAIPAWITAANFPLLDNLDLGHNTLTGGIPDAIWGITSLSELDLSFNPLTSEPLTASIGNLTQLTEMDLSGTDRSGPIPAQIGNFPVIEDLHLSDNLLTGPIPAEIGALTAIDELNLSGNALTGTIPAAMDNLNQLETLDLSNNTMSGQIPAFFTQTGMPALSALSLCGNGGLWTYANAGVQSFVTGLDIRTNLTCIG